MKKTIACAFGFLILSMLIGCSTASREISIKLSSERADVFAEVSGDGPIARGFAGLTIKANIKTHVEGYYILESGESLHGKEKYPFLFNIDGQAVQWEVAGVSDIKPAYDAGGKTSDDPEAREGVKYVLKRRLRLAAGTHKIFFGLPEDNYAAEVTVSLGEGKSSTLEFKPIYRCKKLPTRIPTFLNGIDRYEVYIDDKQIL